VESAVASEQAIVVVVRGDGERGDQSVALDTGSQFLDSGVVVFQAWLDSGWQDVI